MPISLEDIQAARERIRSGIYLSPCPESIPLSELCGFPVYCKLDYLQRTGSFKERGARNALLLLSEEERRRGVVAASAGNHALGLAYHGMLLGIRVVVVMPRHAPLIKLSTCQRLNATVILHGSSYAEAKEHGMQLARDEGLIYIHGYDHPAIIAGQGTMGLEVLEQVPDVEAIIVPAGGGGLIAGVATAVKALKPDVQIIGVEPERAPKLSAAVAAGKPVETPVQPTLADGLALSKVGDLAFETLRGKVDRLEIVNEEDLALAVLRLLELEKSVVEGAGAAPLAGCLHGRLADLKGRKTVLLLCGGNIDPMVLHSVIEKGLVADGRLCRFTAVVTDRPGGLANLAQIIASTGASINEIAHDRAFSGPDVASVNIQCTVETTDREHSDRLFALLREKGIEVLPSAGRR